MKTMPMTATEKKEHRKLLAEKMAEFLAAGRKVQVCRPDGRCAGEAARALEEADTARLSRHLRTHGLSSEGLGGLQGDGEGV